MLEGDEADAAVASARRRTTARSHLAHHPRFEDVSPEVGVLDEDAVASGMEEDPDAVLALLADLTGATDVHLRRLSRRLAARLFVDITRSGPARRRGVGRLRTAPFRADGSDLDLDASLSTLVETRAGLGLDPTRLRVQAWHRLELAVCLLVDRSGSMGGAPLATAALAAAAVAWRVPDDHSVLAFAKDVVAVRSQGTAKPTSRVVDDLLGLRGVGTTDLAGALTAARQQLDRSTAGRRLTVLLSDCRATVHGDALAAARALDEVAVVAPDGDAEEATAFAAAVGARLVTVGGPGDVVAALSAVFER